MKKMIFLSGALLFLLVVIMIDSCKKEEEPPAVVASFTATPDSIDFKTVHFTNFSQNYSALLWDFGDAATSTLENPDHTYATLGDFTVVLKATSTDGKTTAQYSKTITITDPDAELTKLVGDGSDGKTWKLIRSGATGRYPIQVFQYNTADPANPVTNWWAMGLNNDELALRPCMLNDEWTFFRDGTFEFKANGDYWAEGNVFDPANICANTADPMTSITGENLSAWSDGTHQFEMNTADHTLKAMGTGAFIGFIKLADDYEVMDMVPFIQDEITYDLVKLTDAATDTLIIQGHYYDNPQTTSAYLGTWRFVLVHYDNPADEPPIPAPIPAPGFTYAVDGLTVTFTNTTAHGDTYAWDFGDNATSTEENPVHTYAADGSYTVKLTATNANGEASLTQTVVISSGILTEQVLTAGAWKLQVSGHAVYVGGGMGLDNWWTCPLANLDGTNAGTADDWSCMTDDEFIFTAGGGYEYKTNGGSRNDGYMGTPNGCWSDAEIAASPGAPFGSCNTHTFTFTPAAGSNRAIIELTNGAGFAAFIGFMKGYYGGENSNNANPPNGGNATNRYEVIAYSKLADKEVLIVSVDISAGHDGSASWTMELERSIKVLTEDILTAGPWKLQVTGHTCYVGGGMGLDNWWICPLANLDGSNTGTTDDWSCMTDDEFIFSAGGGYEYKTNGGSRNDGYMGTPNGCWSDAEIAASPGAPFGSCNTHTFTFTPATETTRAIIVLTNGAGYAAFLGFMKGYYGGENANGANPPNGGSATNQYEVMSYQDLGAKETLVVTVDISTGHDGSASWTMELER
jgi:PKD repeat protein